MPSAHRLGLDVTGEGDADGTSVTSLRNASRLPVLSLQNVSLIMKRTSPGVESSKVPTTVSYTSSGSGRPLGTVLYSVPLYIPICQVGCWDGKYEAPPSKLSTGITS